MLTEKYRNMPTDHLMRIMAKSGVIHTFEIDFSHKNDSMGALCHTFSQIKEKCNQILISLDYIILNVLIDRSIMFPSWKYQNFFFEQLKMNSDNSHKTTILNNQSIDPYSLRYFDLLLYGLFAIENPTSNINYFLEENPFELGPFIFSTFETFSSRRLPRDITNIIINYLLRS